MRLFIVLLGLLALCGCDPFTEMSRDPYADMMPADDNRFSALDREIITTAHSHLEEQGWSSEPIYYTVHATKSGYEVNIAVPAWLSR